MPITINGSGTVTGISAGGLPDAIITQPDLATGVAGTGPAFSAYQSTLQSVANNTWTKYQLQTEEFDTANAFDKDTNYRFQPAVAGYYQLTGNVSFSAVAGEVLSGIYKNGSAFKYGTDISATNIWMQQVTALVYLNGSSDYVELYVFQSTGASRNTYLDGALRGYFQGFLARAA